MAENSTSVESFRFEDESDYEYENWLSCFLKAALLSLLKDVKPSTDRKKIKLLTFDNYDTTTFSLKLVTEWRRLSHFPAKMTLVRTRALLGIEKISFS